MKKISFSDTLSESFRFFFAHTGLFFHLVTLPWILSLAVRIVGSTLGDSSMTSLVIEKVIEVVPTTMFLTAWMRVVLLGPGRLERLPGLGWSPRETAMLIHLVKVAGMTFALVAGMLLIIGTLTPPDLSVEPDPETLRRQAYALPLGLGSFVSMVLAFRISYGLAATAVDVPFSPRLSWTYGKGSAAAIIGSVFLLFFIGNIATAVSILIVGGVVHGFLGDGLGPLVVIWTVAYLVSYAGLALVATAHAIIFRTLLAWREGKTLPPPS